MTTDVLTALFIVVAIATICYIILGIYSLVKGLKNNKVAENSIPEIESRTNDLEQFYKEIEPLLEELGQKRKIGFQEYDFLPESSRISYFKAYLKAGIEAGIEYKNLCTASAKGKEIELRKFCIEQHPDKRSYLSERIEYAEILYQYLTTGKQSQKK